MTPRRPRIDVSRRTLLQGGLAGGAALWIGASEHARREGSGRPRLAVIALQGGMDGLSLAPPLKDEHYLNVRGPLAIADPLPFLPDFGLHPAMPGLAAMAQAGEVRLAPAAAAPTRTRSHEHEFQVLSAGVVHPGRAQGGWLNRAVQVLDPGGELSAISLDPVSAGAVEGAGRFGSWAPGAAQLDSDFARRLSSLYADDPQLKEIARTARLVHSRASTASEGPAASDLVIRARTLGRLFEREDGPSVGYLTAGGFDTHQHQGAAQGLLADRFRDLDQALAALKESCGSAWSRCVVVAFTEFGRTASANGVGGTDHGVASAALLLGGGVGKGGLLGDWPTLAPERLFEGRDLAPGLDLYALFKGVLADHMGVSRRQLDGMVFPETASASPLRGLAA
jgi:uncharacterized protein (DUF1501 family)